VDVELIISGGVIVTIDDQRRVIKDGAIVMVKLLRSISPPLSKINSMRKKPLMPVGK